MGIEIDFIKHVDGRPVYGQGDQVHGWDHCLVVLEMTNPWYDEARDSDGEHQQVSIDQAALEQANLLLPWTLERYFQWRDQHYPNAKPWSFHYDFTHQEVFDSAREFIRKAWLNGDGAHVSF